MATEVFCQGQKNLLEALAKARFAVLRKGFLFDDVENEQGQ
jgi:hypothetical protein